MNKTPAVNKTPASHQTPALYVWHGVNLHGEKVSGQQLAESKQVLLHLLAQQRIRVRWAHKSLSWPAPKLSAQDVTQLARQLATLLQAGIPLLQSLDVLARTQPNTPTHAAATRIRQHIEAGHALHQALRQESGFDNLFCSLVQVGEMTGALDQLLARIATHREKSQALQNAVRSAMVYPLTVLCVAGGVSAVLLVFVVPAFQSVFDSLNAELPALTRWLIALSTGVQTYGWLMLLGLLLGAWACRRWLLQQPRIAHAWQGLLLRLPWVGHLVHQACMARWSRTLATLLHAGIPLTEALVAVASVVGNLHYAVATQRVHAQLMQGQSLASSLAQHSPVFQPMLIQLCDIGEASGTLDHMLDKAADHFEDSVNRSVAHLSVLVEPLMMMVLGLLIGCMVLALYLPMFQMGQAL